jgi:hypothetical protein
LGAWDDIAALFAPAARERRRDQPYTRPGDPRGLLLTAKQWADYDEWTAHCDWMDAKYGHLRSVSGVAALARSVW